MDSLEQIIDILAWPITTIIVVLVLRSPLSELVPTLKKLKYKDLELEFEREASNILAEAERDLPEISEEPIKEKEEATIMFSRRRAEPSTEILGSWRDLELTIRELAKKHGISPGKSIRSLIKSLESNNLISNEISKITLDLSALRNKVAHSDENIITYNLSNSFSNSVSRVNAALKEENNA